MCVYCFTACACLLPVFPCSSGGVPPGFTGLVTQTDGGNGLSKNLTPLTYTQAETDKEKKCTHTNLLALIYEQR